MSYQITEEMRRVLLDRAVEALRTRLACGPDAGRIEQSRLGERATMAVTDAVTRGDHVHTLIALAVGCSGLRVIDYIGDNEAQAQALAVEFNAAENYKRQVRAAQRAHALRRLGAGAGGPSLLTRQLGLKSRTMVYDWIAEAGLSVPDDADVSPNRHG